VTRSALHEAPRAEMRSSSNAMNRLREICSDAISADETAWIAIFLNRD